MVSRLLFSLFSFHLQTFGAYRFKTRSKGSPNPGVLEKQQPALSPLLEQHIRMLDSPSFSLLAGETPGGRVTVPSPRGELQRSAWL